MTANLLERLRALDTCAVSDALDHLHLSGATTGVRPMHQGCAKIAGYARTVEVVDAPAAPRASTWPPGPSRPPARAT